MTGRRHWKAVKTARAKTAFFCCCFPLPSRAVRHAASPRLRATLAHQSPALTPSLTRLPLSSRLPFVTQHASSGKYHTGGFPRPLTKHYAFSLTLVPPAHLIGPFVAHHASQTKDRDNRSERQHNHEAIYPRRSTRCSSLRPASLRRSFCSAARLATAVLGVGTPAHRDAAADRQLYVLSCLDASLAR